MVEFRWGAESAHEDSVGLVVLVSTEPPALLTSGADRCVKAWTLDGGAQGLLLQGLAPHAPNPRWSFRFVLLSGLFCLFVWLCFFLFFFSVILYSFRRLFLFRRGTLLIVGVFLFLGGPTYTILGSDYSVRFYQSIMILRCMCL